MAHGPTTHDHGIFSLKAIANRFLAAPLPEKGDKKQKRRRNLKEDINSNYRIETKSQNGKKIFKIETRTWTLNWILLEQQEMYLKEIGNYSCH